MPRTWNRTTKKGSWSEQTLAVALKYIEDGNSIRATVNDLFNIPYTTLCAMKAHEDLRKLQLGCGDTFTTEQKAQPASRVKLLAEIFYGLMPMTRQVAFDFAERNNISH